ncbi:MAG: OmpA family protein, partial [Cyclobacteriaceae bacterium]
ITGAELFIMTHNGDEFVSTSDSEGRFSFSVMPEDNFLVIGRKDNIAGFYTGNADEHTKSNSLVNVALSEELITTDMKNKRANLIIVDNVSGQSQIIVNIDNKMYELNHENSFAILTGNDGKAILNSSMMDWEKSNLLGSAERLVKDAELELEKSTEINSIFFDLNAAFVRNDAMKELENIVQIMEKYPTLNLELVSFADSRGYTQYNDKLARIRSNSVFEYLVSRGIDKYRIITDSFGERVLVNDCYDGVPCSEEKHQENRRTEFKVMY